MKFITALSAALLTLAPVASFAQDASTTGRGAGAKPAAPASENGDTSIGNTREPGATGRSSSDDGITAMPPASPSSPVDLNGATNVPKAPSSPSPVGSNGATNR